MHYPIVKVITKDRLELFGFLAEAKSDTVLLNIHGTAAAFYVEEFEKYYCELLPPKGIAVLFTNNRGNHVLESWQKTGAALEKFEDCLIDIDAWIKLALKLGYKKVILQGHSLGTEKVVYYMEKGAYRKHVVAVILLGVADSFGTQQLFLKKAKVDLMKEARSLLRQKKGYQFLTGKWLSHAGTLPQNAESYVNFFHPGSELSKALPLRTRKLEYYSKISVPVLSVIGDQKEYTVIPVKEALSLLRAENPNAEVYQLKNCNHDFDGKQAELVAVVTKFLKRI